MLVPRHFQADCHNPKPSVFLETIDPSGSPGAAYTDVGLQDLGTNPMLLLDTFSVLPSGLSR